MAITIRVGEIGDYAWRQSEKLLRAAVLETDGMLKQASPVDTGRFRMSWQVGENSASSTPAPEGSYPSAPSIMRVGYQQERLGNLYSVHNNLPYAEPLANGHSTKAPAGWIDNIANDVRTRVRDAAERINRES